MVKMQLGWIESRGNKFSPGSLLQGIYVGGSLTHQTYKVRSLAFLFALPHFSAVDTLKYLLGHCAAATSTYIPSSSCLAKSKKDSTIFVLKKGIQN